MNYLKFLAFAGLAGAPLFAEAVGWERNAWPFWVGQMDENAPGTAPVKSWQAIGPLFFKDHPAPDGHYQGVRPFYLRQNGKEGRTVKSVVYPIFSYQRDGEYYSWTVFNLINRFGPADAAPSAPAATGRGFDVWPFYFSRQGGAPEDSYRALFPVYGTLKNRFWNQEISWVAFPLFARFEKKGGTTTAAPWPFIKHLGGNGHHGFGVWPIYGQFARAGDYRQQYLLWPLLYRSQSKLSEPVPTVREGFLPFYTRERSAGLKSETYLWPFFGYTDQTAPKRYHENRYFWPFLVQGRGEERHINRWAPFYTHSVVKGIDKTWFAWPLWRNARWTDNGLSQERTQLLFFLYWSHRQRSATNPALPAASKTHFWPVLSVWDNGAGRRQAQAPNPLEVFFPNNDRIRRLYTPLFALYRFDQGAPGHVRHSLLWNFVTWRRTEQRSEFHLGPLFSRETGNRTSRYAIGNGLLGVRKSSAGGWRMFMFDFSSNQADNQAVQPVLK